MVCTQLSLLCYGSSWYKFVVWTLAKCLFDLDFDQKMLSGDQEALRAKSCRIKPDFAPRGPKSTCKLSNNLSRLLKVLFQLCIFGC